MKFLVRRELQLNWKGFLISTLICSALSLYLIGMIPSLGADIKALVDLKFPPKLQLAFGMQGLDYAKPMHSYAMMFSYLYLTFGIYAASLFARIVAKEFTDKTAEYLFSLPAKRIDLILAKLGVAGGYLLASILVTFLLSWLGFATIIGGPGHVQPLLVMTVAYAVGSLFFAAFSFLLSAYYIKSRLAVGLVLGAYLLQVVISLNGNLTWLKYASPFDWFKGNDIVQSGGLYWDYLLVALLGTVVCFVLGMRRFVRREVLV